MKLNLGSGQLGYKEGWVNVDIKDDIKLDVEWDLNKFPYPFEDSTFDEVLIRYVLEYLDNPIRVLKEIARITKNNARIFIYVIHANSYSGLSQINFKVNFTENSFNFKRFEQYGIEGLKLVNVELIFDNWKKYIPLKKFLKIFLNGLYDKIKFEIEVIKQDNGE